MSKKGPERQRLEEQVHNLRPHDHLCAIYETNEQRLAAVVPFFRDGLAKRERCLYLTDQGSGEEVRMALQDAGVDTAAAVKKGSLQISVTPAYLTNGVFDAATTVEFFNASVRQSKEQGYVGQRFMGEMTWVLQTPPGHTRLAEFEMMIDDFYATHEAMGLCQYDRKRFPAETLLEVIKTHPLILYDGKVTKNPYYVPHQLYLGSTGAEMELRRLLESLKDHESAAVEQEQSRQTVLSLSARLLKAQDDERRRIALQLHETTVQSLIAMKMNLARIARSGRITETSLRNALDESLALAEQSLQELRTLSHLLHPPLIEEAGLLAALRWYVEGFGDRSGMQVTLDLPPELERLPGQVELAVFRVIQEALTNVMRHAHSLTVKVTLKSDPESIRLEIKDAGKGMEIHAVEKAAGIGIEGMRDRVGQLGGTIDIRSGSNGTTLTAVIPKNKGAPWQKLVS